MITVRRDRALAEGVGFEPTETRASTVFKTVPFVRSGIPPGPGDCNGWAQRVTASNPV